MIFLLVTIAVFNKLVYRSFLNPIFIHSVVWLGYYLVLFFNIGAYDVYLKDINKFILLQSLGFSIGGLICTLFSRTATIYDRHQVSAIDINKAFANITLFYPFVLLIIFGAIAFIGLESGSLSLFSIMNFRDALSEDDGKKVGAIGTLQLLVSIYVILYIGTIVKNREKWYRPVLLIGAFIYFTLLLGSKGQFVYFFCATAYLVIWQKKINKTYLVISTVGFLGILALLFYLRAGGQSDSITEDSAGDLMLIYTVTALPALYLSQVAAPKIFGYYTFRVLYVWLNKIGFDFPVAPVLSEWVVTPLPTNVYSYIMPYFRDFSYTGAFVMPFILGFIHNFIYFRANKGSFVFLVLNSLLIYAIVTQVWEENYFRQITNWAYILLVILIVTKVSFRSKKWLNCDWQHNKEL
ncbi:MAG: hypothetical protein JWQ96_2797 [Segetibacter sp.]|nr:hypothetical protein [Segetibacter sp.]